LVIEDADHTYETSSAVLRFFHSYLRGEEYIVIEDGIISDLNQDQTTNSGPHRAIKEFIAANPGEYDSDSRYSDFFGYNFTWGTNGFLKKKKYPLNKQIEKRLITEFNQDDPAPLGVESQMCVNERFQVYLTIRRLLERRPSYTFIEVGSYSGASFKLIHSAFQRLGSQARGYSVEPGGTAQFYEIMSTLPNVEHFRMYSDKAAPLLADRLHSAGVKAEYIMIDGDHSYEGVRNDILNYYPLLALGGIMIFHDYLPELNSENREAIMFHHGGNEPGIRQACQELMERQYKSELLELPLLYPTDPTQTQPHLPVIPGVMSTIRAYRKV
jgi:cephalosporin hydroxylase